MGVQEADAGHNQNTEGAYKKPLPSKHVGEQSDGHNGGRHEYSNEEAGTEEANALLTFAQHMCLPDPVINVLRVRVVCVVLIVLQVV